MALQSWLKPVVLTADDLSSIRRGCAFRSRVHAEMGKGGLWALGYGGKGSGWMVVRPEMPDLHRGACDSIVSWLHEGFPSMAPDRVQFGCVATAIIEGKGEARHAFAVMSAGSPLAKSLRRFMRRLPEPTTPLCGPYSVQPPAMTPP